MVDDDELNRFTLCKVMEFHGFDVSVAADVPDALRQITTDRFDAVVDDLHMPGAADGLTVISAMRHANPTAATFLLSANADMSAAARAPLLQPDEIFTRTSGPSAHRTRSLRMHFAAPIRSATVGA